MSLTRQLHVGTKHEMEHTASRKVARRIALDHLREDPKYYTHLGRMERKVKCGEWNPAFSERQRRFMCMELRKKTTGKTTKTKMSAKDLRDFCQKPVVPKNKRKGAWMKKVKTYRKRHAKNPHLATNRDFIGMFLRNDITAVRRLLKVHGVRGVKITKDMVHGDARYRELYVAKGRGQMATMLISRLYGRRAA